MFKLIEILIAFVEMNFSTEMAMSLPYYHGVLSTSATSTRLRSRVILRLPRTRLKPSTFMRRRKLGGIKFRCYNGGHVLGAVMFMLVIAGVNILHYYELCVCLNGKCWVYMFQLPDINNFTRSGTQQSLVLVDKIEYKREDILVILIPEDVEVCGKIFYTRSTRTFGST